MKYLSLPLLLLSLNFAPAQDQVLPLWPEGIPCANNLEMEIREDAAIGRRIARVREPEMAVYLPAESAATGTGVVICPGGGYTILAWDWEGVRIAEWFNSFGVAAFVLKYRLPHWETAECRGKVALMDAQRALRLVRSEARKWKLDPGRIGIMGFSAGGHLASTAATHFDRGDPGAELPVERYGARPDFAILLYPVVTMDSTYAHLGSRTNLIGADPDPDLINYYSNEAQVTAETPPTILIHADDDRGVVPENSVNFYLALRRHGVPAALHIYEKGGHGFSTGEGRGAVAGWRESCRAWMEDRGLLRPFLRALIVDGQNNHDNWPETTPVLTKHLEQTGLFSVDVATTPPAGKSMDSFRPNFSAYDLVVSNYNGAPWPKETQDAFEAFVRNGGGFVSIHAADNAFPDWKAYNLMIGLGGWEGRTEKDGPYVYLDETGTVVRDESPGPGGHHGRRHEFVIRMRQPDHPITRGLPEKWLHTEDELYGMMRGPAENMTILATAFSSPEQGGTGRHEPVLMTVHYGLGRVFHSTMGHLKESQRCAGFAATFRRGAEWAATGTVTQEPPQDFPTETETKLPD